MRKDWLNILFKCVKYIHLENILYVVARVLWHPHVTCLEDTTTYLHSISPDSHATCLRTNKITPLYDVHFIIPVYNAAPYLIECIQSVLSQNTQYTFHLTIVNDGSTDQSTSILEEYKSNTHITIITQTNQGQAAARNRALENILGRYIFFLDADDKIADGAIEKMVSLADKTGVDLILGNTIRFNSVHKWGQSHYTKLIQSSIVCNKLHKATLWKERCFPINNKYEDAIFPLLIEPTIKSYQILDDLVYYYRDTPNSVSTGHMLSPRRIETLYITQIALEAAAQAQITFTQTQYHLFLRQCWHNTKRIAILGNHTLDNVVYQEQRKLQAQYFSCFSTDESPYCEMEKRLHEDNFRLWYLFCLST